MGNKDLTDIIKLAQNGDNKAFEQIYIEYAKSTYFIALKLLQNQENSEEVTQDIFVYVYNKISDLKDPQAFPAWLKKITTSKCIDFLRKNRPLTVDIEEIADSEFIEEHDPKLIPEKSLDNKATAQLIIEIIDNLPIPQKVCVYYYYYEHLSVKEIAVQLEIKETTVKNRLALARDKIRIELEKLEDKEGIKLYSAFPLFLIPLLKSAADNTELPQELLSKMLSSIGAETVATAAATTTGTSSAAITAKAGLSLKAIISAVAGVAVTGGIVASVVLVNSKPDTVDVAVTDTGISVTTMVDQVHVETDNTILQYSIAEPTLPTTEVVEIWFGCDGITDEMLVEMVVDGTIPQNVTNLNLNSNKITDVSSLANLTSLTVLDLSGNPIIDLSSVSDLTNLTELNLHNAGKRNLDISPLSKLTNLTYLDLCNTDIIDISPLSNLTNLMYLDLQDSKISDVSSLSGLTNLTYLDLAQYPKYPKKNRVTDLSPLKDLTKLEYLNLYEHQITDISILGNMKNLTNLNLGQNNISDISILCNLKNLTNLSLWGNEIEDISTLSQLTNLNKLSIDNNNINDISPLYGLTNITEIDITGNQISEEQIAKLKEILPNCWFYP